MANGWNLRVWLVSVVYLYYRYPHNNYYFPATPLVLTLFLAVSSLFLFSCFFFFFCTCIEIAQGYNIYI